MASNHPRSKQERGCYESGKNVSWNKGKWIFSLNSDSFMRFQLDVVKIGLILTRIRTPAKVKTSKDRQHRNRGHLISELGFSRCLMWRQPVAPMVSQAPPPPETVLENFNGIYWERPAHSHKCLIICVLLSLKPPLTPGSLWSLLIATRILKGENEPFEEKYQLILKLRFEVGTRPCGRGQSSSWTLPVATCAAVIDAARGFVFHRRLAC